MSYKGNLSPEGFCLIMVNYGGTESPGRGAGVHNLLPHRHRWHTLDVQRTAHPRCLANVLNEQLRKLKIVSNFSSTESNHNFDIRDTNQYHYTTTEGTNINQRCKVLKFRCKLCPFHLPLWQGQINEASTPGDCVYLVFSKSF